MTRRSGHINLTKIQPAPPTMCGGKRRYNSEREAEDIAEQQELLNFASNLQLKTYRCAVCSGWHLTRNGIYLDEEIRSEREDHESGSK